MLPLKKKKFTNTILLSIHRIRCHLKKGEFSKNATTVIKNLETKNSRTTKVFPDCNSISYNIEAVHEQVKNIILLRKS